MSAVERQLFQRLCSICRQWAQFGRYLSFWLDFKIPLTFRSSFKVEFLSFFDTWPSWVNVEFWRVCVCLCAWHLIQSFIQKFQVPHSFEICVSVLCDFELRTDFRSKEEEEKKLSHNNIGIKTITCRKQKLVSVTILQKLVRCFTRRMFAFWN